MALILQPGVIKSLPQKRAQWDDAIKRKQVKPQTIKNKENLTDI